MYSKNILKRASAERSSVFKCSTTRPYYICTTIPIAFEGCCSVDVCQRNGNCPDSENDNLRGDDVKPQEPEVITKTVNHHLETATTTADSTNSVSATSDSDSDSTINTGAIIGGTVGGIAGLLIIGALIYLLRGRFGKKPAGKAQRLHNNPDTEYNNNAWASPASVAQGTSIHKPHESYNPEQWPYPSPHPATTAASIKRASAGGHSVDLDVHPVYAELPTHNNEPVELAGHHYNTNTEYAQGASVVPAPLFVGADQRQEYARRQPSGASYNSYAENAEHSGYAKSGFVDGAPQQPHGLDTTRLKGAERDPTLESPETPLLESRR